MGKMSCEFCRFSHESACVSFLIGKLKKDNGFLIHMYSATIEMIFLNSIVLAHNTGLVDGTSSECIADCFSRSSVS